MKLKYPKKITIGSTDFKIKYDKTNSGGSFTFDNPLITIGTYDLQHGNDIYVFMIMCHEIMEVINTMSCTRYHCPGDTDFKFFMSHKEFRTNIELFATAIRNFIE